MSGTVSKLHEFDSGSENHQSANAVVAVANDTSVQLDMGEKTSKSKRDVTGKSKRKFREPPPAPVKEGLTTVAHCCVFAFVLLILYLCFKQPVEFFTWHPLLLSIGWMLLMSEAILVISKENPLARRLQLNHDSRILWHWVLFVIGGVLIAAGFLIITINKNRLNKFHYTSWHGLLGLIAVVAYIVPCANGTVLYFKKELRSYLNPKIVKLVHVITGTLCFFCGGISLVLSVYTKWFSKRTDHNLYVFLFGFVITVFPTVWVAQRPLIKCVKNIYKLFSEED